GNPSVPPWQTTLEPWSVHQTITLPSSPFVSLDSCFLGSARVIGPRRRASTPAKEQGYKLHGGQHTE
ncbi:2372_t:CDS:1, partial [Paraglomus occultum]